MALTREQILAAEDLPQEEVEVWGGTVLVRALTAAEFHKLTRESDRKAKTPDALESMFALHLVAACVIDDAGKQIFTRDDVQALADKGWPAVQKVFTACLRLNGLGEDVVKGLAGNSNGTQKNDSGTS